MKRPVRGHDEQNALTGWRRSYIWRGRNALPRIKRRYRRRERREADRAIRRGEDGRLDG